MADEKFTGLPAGSSPFADTSVMAMSEDDGGFLSIKITVAQLKVLLGSDIAKLLDNGSTMDAEQFITFNSSGTNKTLVTDSATTAGITFDNDGFNNITLEAILGQYGRGTVDASDGYIFLQANDASDHGFLLALENSNNAGRNAMGLFADDSGATGRIMWSCLDNRSNAHTTGITDTYLQAFSAKNATVNSGALNAVIAGGDGIIGDKTGVLHTQTMSVKINDLGSTGSNQTLTIEDGAHVKITPTGNLTINVNTYSTNNTVNWTLEVDNSGGHTITQGTGIVNAGGGTWAAFATGTEVIEFKSMTSGSHLLTNQLANIS